MASTVEDNSDVHILEVSKDSDVESSRLNYRLKNGSQATQRVSSVRDRVIVVKWMIDEATAFWNGAKAPVKDCPKVPDVFRVCVVRNTHTCPEHSIALLSFIAGQL
jgi:hypothetical protein